jgi:hypothetical protein
MRHQSAAHLSTIPAAASSLILAAVVGPRSSFPRRTKQSALRNTHNAHDAQETAR